MPGFVILSRAAGSIESYLRPLLSTILRPKQSLDSAGIALVNQSAFDGADKFAYTAVNPYIDIRGYSEDLRTAL